MSEILTREQWQKNIDSVSGNGFVATPGMLRDLKVHDEALRKRVAKLEKASEDIWTELVRRGWAKEIGESKFRSLVAEKTLVRLVDQLPGTYVNCGRHYFPVVRGDETCPICKRIVELGAERDAALLAKTKAEDALMGVRRIVETDLRCNHPQEAEEMTPENETHIGLCSGDDCIYCAFLRVIDAALFPAALAATKPEGENT